MSQVANITNVARREFTVRVRTRSFLVGTVLLVLGVIAIAMAPVVIGYLGRGGEQRVAVWVGASDLQIDPVPTLASLLNATPGTPASAPGGEGTFVVHRVDDLATVRTAVEAGQESAALAVERAENGDLRFTLYTNESSTGRTTALVQQAATAVAVADRLNRLGVAPANQATLFAPADYTVRSPDPNQAGSGPPTGAEQGSTYALGFGMTIVIFMMIILYGQWVAMSVVEEKSSRVMEVILNAATPFQLLSGKVLGVGAVALTQYAALLVAGGVALLAQGPIASALLGVGGTDSSLPAGLTLGLLALLCVYGVLGFLLYAVLFAAAGSLVSRQEEVNQVVMPMTLVATAGYLIGVYTSTGLLDIRAGWLTVLSQIPFLSPFLMLSRVSSGEAAPWEVGLSVALLVLGIVVAIWVAARIYRAGVLLYGQRPGLRAIWRLLRTGI